MDRPSSGGLAGRLIAAAALAALVAAPAALGDYRPQDEPPFGGRNPPALVTPATPDRPPPGFALSARDAVAIAERAEAVRSERDGNDELVSAARLRGAGVWQVSYATPSGEERAVAFVSDDEGGLIEAWRGNQLDTPLARGYEDAVGGPVNEAWLFIPLALAFFLPFFDRRNPFRLLHLDLLVLLGFSASLYFFNKGMIDVSVPIVYPLLGYLFARLVLAGFTRSETRSPLLPHLPRAALVAGIVALCGVQLAIAVTSDKVIDVGLASVIGADHIAGGDELYGEGTAEELAIRGDVYGPVNYLAYVPFEQAFPWSGEWDSLPAARYAGLAFSLLSALALFALGRRLREGEEGRTLGVAMAYGWLAYPFTSYVVASGFNDALVPLGITLALLAAARPALRGALLALAALTKFGPLALAPLFAAGEGNRSLSRLLPFVAGFAGAAALVTLPLLPDGGFSELYDRSLGYQASRGSPFSIWGLEPDLSVVQDAAKVFAVLIGAALFFAPRRRDTIQLAALAGAVIVATQVAATHWLYPYTVWFAPLVLIVAFARERGPEPPART